VTAERDEVGVSRRDDGLRRIRREAACRDQGPRELRPQMLGGDRRLAMRDLLGALDTRLDDVEVSDAQAIELTRHVAESCERIAIRH
jgi:hypothetical protein